MASETERAAMRRALAMSAGRLGTTNPNPCVGAVVIDAGGVTLGEGVTEPAGGAHAEAVALRAAGAGARGATLVSTLEPCRHVGRTGACTAAIVAAGVARVVYAVSDPHDVAAGGGEVLRAEGVDVESGVLADEADSVLGRWLVAAGRRRPHLTWKYAATLDGRTAAVDGTSRWITGPEARVDVHRERFEADAVVVGIGTVLADNPSLTVRDWPANRQPLRVVVDSTARTPLDAAVLDGSADTLVGVAEDAPAARVAALRTAGAQVVALPRAGAGVDLEALMAALWEREVLVALLEGGARLAAGFVAAGLVDRVLGYHAPVLLGSGTSVLADFGVGTLGDARRLRLDEVSAVGGDLRVVAHLATAAQITTDARITTAAQPGTGGA